MAATEAELERTDGRMAAVARWLRGLMILGAVVVGLAVVHYAIASFYDFDDPNEGDPWDLEVWEWALVTAPIWLPLAAAVLLILAGGKRLAGLRSGDAGARMKVNTLSYACALGTILYAGWMYYRFGYAEGGFGIRNHTLGVAVEDLTNGSLNPVGWVGIAAFLGLVVLFVGSLTVATITRPPRGEQD